MNASRLETGDDGGRESNRRSLRTLLALLYHRPPRAKLDSTGPLPC
jgi:hypothetical protein